MSEINHDDDDDDGPRGYGMSSRILIGNTQFVQCKQIISFIIVWLKYIAI